MSFLDGITIDKASATPRHVQLSEQLRNLVVDGVLPPQSLLPSDNQMMNELGLSRSTVRQAVQTLVDEGLLYRVRGKGTYVGVSKAQSGEAMPYVGFFMATPAPGSASGFTGDLLHRLFHLLQQHGMTFRFFAVDPGNTESFRFEDYRDTNMTAAIFVGEYLVDLEDRFWDASSQLGCRVVCLDYNMDHIGILSVVSRNRWGGEQATSYLAGQGASRIAYVGRPNHNYDLRLAGYMRGLDRSGLSRDNRIIWMDPEVAAAELEQEPGLVDAVFCCSDAVATRIINLFHRLQVSVPEDVKVVSYDDVSIASLADPPLTCISVNRQDMAMKAFQALTGRVDGLVLEAETRLVVRGSA